MRGRRSRALSLNTLISIGGVAVGVMALIVVLGVMNGLRNDLRERILVANPHLRILTFGTGLRLDNWREVIEQVRKEPGVVAAAPEVISQSLISAGSDYARGGSDRGIRSGHRLLARSHPCRRRSPRATSSSSRLEMMSTGVSSLGTGCRSGFRCIRETW